MLMCQTNNGFPWNIKSDLHRIGLLVEELILGAVIEEEIIEQEYPEILALLSLRTSLLPTTLLLQILIWFVIVLLHRFHILKGPGRGRRGQAEQQLQRSPRRQPHWVIHQQQPPELQLQPGVNQPQPQSATTAPPAVDATTATDTYSPFGSRRGGRGF